MPTTRIYLHGIGDHKHDWFESYRGLLPDNIGAFSSGFHYEDLLEQSVWGSRAEAIATGSGMLAKVLSREAGGAWGPAVSLGLKIFGDRAAHWVGDYGADVPAYLKDVYTMELVLTRLHQQVMSADNKVELHGYSLGAAVADEYCRRYAGKQHPVTKLVTYGAPQGKRLARTILERRSGPPSEVPWVNYHGKRDWVAGYPFPTPWGRQSTALPERHYPKVTNRELECGHDFGAYLVAS